MVRTIIAICLYVGLFNVYIWLLPLSTHYAHLLYNYLTPATAIFYVFNQSKNEKIKELNYVLASCWLTNFVLILLHWHDIIDYNTPTLFHWFNGLIFANTIIIFTCMKRHGFLKK